MEMQYAESANFPLASNFGDNYTFCFKDEPGHLCKRWLEENETSPFFCSLKELGTSSLIPSPMQEDSPFHDGVWELQMEDKISVGKKLFKGTSFPPVTKTLFREAFNIFLDNI